jgi:endonuclease/exonuclease/phosphatase family metal-dependent hydrolase
VLVRGIVEVSKASVLPFRKDGRFPSDHFPVVAWMRLLD